MPAQVGGGDYLKITPTHLAALLAGAASDAAPESGLPRVALLLGGEAPPWALVDEVMRRAPGVAVFNHYLGRRKRRSACCSIRSHPRRPGRGPRRRCWAGRSRT